MKSRILFFGTAELACASLAALARSDFASVVAVVSQPDKPKGRDLKLQPTPIKTTALKCGFTVLQPLKARDPAFVQQLLELHLDLIVVAAYGQILPPAILDLPRFGCLNVHTSLLPKYRGAAPIQWALLNGETETGVTIMKMDAGLDTGDILSQEQTSILASDNAQSLHDRLENLGAGLLVKTIPDYLAGKIQPRPQPVEGVSYARKITKEDGKLDWAKSAQLLWNSIRAFTPWPGAFTFLPGAIKPLLLKVWAAEVQPDASGEPGRILSADKNGILVACGSGSLRITELQREGGRRMTAQEFVAGHKLESGCRLG